MAVLLLLKIAGKFAQQVHQELSLPTGFFALGFSSQYSVWWEKKGEMYCRMFGHFSILLEKRGQNTCHDHC